MPLQPADLWCSVAPSCQGSQEGPYESALCHASQPLAGLVRAVCWSIRDKSEARAACCEVHLVSLALPDSSSGPCQVTGVEVLQVGHSMHGVHWQHCFCPNYIGLQMRTT